MFAKGYKLRMSEWLAVQRYAKSPELVDLQR